MRFGRLFGGLIQSELRADPAESRRVIECDIEGNAGKYRHDNDEYAHVVHTRSNAEWKTVVPLRDGERHGVFLLTVASGGGGVGLIGYGSGAAFGGDD
ncbi:protein of unknown function [Hyphomicrobium sp. MC1]|nr:protein of unknown function [Hyphomicrobium sp. MC1]